MHYRTPVQSSTGVAVPGTPSPKKKKAPSSSASVVDSPVIRLLESMKAGDVDPIPSPRPVRARTKTPKALALEEEEEEALRTAKKPAPRSNKATARDAPAKPSSVVRLGSPIEIPDSDGSDLPFAPRFETPSRAVFPTNKTSKQFIDDEAISVKSDLSDDDPKEEEELNEFIVGDDVVEYASDAESLATNAPVAASVRSISPEVPYEEAPPAEVTETTDEQEIFSDDPQEVLDFVTVMDPSLQEDLMKPTYVNLPPLDFMHDSRTFHTRPYSYDADLFTGKIKYANISATAKLMSPENAKLLATRSLFKCLGFVSHGFYINGVRMSPTAAIDYNGRLCLRRGNVGSHCVMITVGLVSASHLFNSSVPVGRENQEQHRLTIAKFPQEAQRENAFIAQVLGMYSGIYSPTSDLDSGYAISAYRPSVSTGETDRGSLYSHVSQPFIRKVAPLGSAKYIVEYDESVPVLDGRAETGEPFRFRPEDFDRLPSWRSWGRNQTELSEDAVVSIGYNASHFNASRTGNRYLVPNILFVILLHDPTDGLVMGLEPAAASSSKMKGKTPSSKSKAAVSKTKARKFASVLQRYAIQGGSGYGASKDRLSEAQLKSLLPLRLLDVQSMLLGSPTRVRMSSGPIYSPKRIPLEHLNQVPKLFTDFRHILSTHLQKRGTQGISSSSDRIGYRMRLYSDMSRRVARKQAETVLGNLSSLALHVSFLMDGHLFLPDSIRHIEQLLMDDRFKGFEEQELKSLHNEIRKYGPSLDDDDVLKTASLMKNTLCIATLLSPVLLLLPHDYTDIGGKDGIVSLWRQLAAVERPEFLKKADDLLWEVLFSVAEGKDLITEIEPILPVMEEILNTAQPN
ncbi:hypothetical protein H0H93_005672, partial [Arthromyces matolae]